MTTEESYKGGFGTLEVRSSFGETKDRKEKQKREITAYVYFLNFIYLILC